jgi:diguanylate cyclase (GGDEF)-like protein
VASAAGSEISVSGRLVVLPLALLSLVFILTLVAVWAVGLDNKGLVIGVLSLSFLAFAGTAAVLFKIGSSQIDRLAGLGHSDLLTGMPNRRAFHAGFEQQQQSIQELAVALIDLDGFLKVNEQYGHDVGDKAICECAQVIDEICEGEATVYRLGGDEFALLVAGPIAGTILEGLSRRIVERLNRPVEVGTLNLTMGASVGLARLNAKDVSSSEALRQAEVAMYASKRGGKGRCTWFSEDFDVTREQMRALDDELGSALIKEQFHLVYQPLVDSQSRDIVAVEALIRWARPDGKQIGPNVFIPVAEQSGLINPIGLWVLRTACRDAMQWGQIKLSVNISAAQLRNPEFPTQLGQILEEIGFDPSRLELEITETCLVLDPVLAERSLSVIRGFGVNVVLDDFGTGYASIGFLRQFRFEKLKLDRSLVVQASQDSGSRAMMLSSITVARALNMAVTAEGVETDAQATMVRAAGCDQIQGFLFHKPMTNIKLTQLLKAQNNKLAAISGAMAEENDRPAGLVQTPIQKRSQKA